eukprot:9960464-Alexandrium_andersonii.AAC.1
MSASLVGSEMCIRDRTGARANSPQSQRRHTRGGRPPHPATESGTRTAGCLLYTSDAADDM